MNIKILIKITHNPTYSPQSTVLLNDYIGIVFIGPKLLIRKCIC